MATSTVSGNVLVMGCSLISAGAAGGRVPPAPRPSCWCGRTRVWARRVATAGPVPSSWGVRCAARSGGSARGGLLGEEAAPLCPSLRLAARVRHRGGEQQPLRVGMGRRGGHGGGVAVLDDLAPVHDGDP